MRVGIHSMCWSDPGSGTAAHTSLAKVLAVVTSRTLVRLERVSGVSATVDHGRHRAVVGQRSEQACFDRLKSGLSIPRRRWALHDQEFDQLLTVIIGRNRNR